MPKVAVIGGSGFVGSYVVDELCRRNFSVINIDLESPKWTLLDHDYRKGDILNFDQIDSLIDADVDYIINFGGLADINEALSRPVQTIRQNVMGNLHLLEVARSKKIKKFVYASSVYAFSNQSSFYGVSKNTSEHLVEEYWKQFGLKFVILRYGSLYGERADHHNGIYRLLYQALQDGRVDYSGSGEESREYIHCKDAATLTVDILDSEIQNERFTLTGMEKLKIKEVINLVSEMLGKELEVKYRKTQQDGHYLTTPISFQPKIGKKLVNNPRVDLEQGLLGMLKRIYEDINRHDESDLGDPESRA